MAHRAQQANPYLTLTLTFTISDLNLNGVMAWPNLPKDPSYTTDRALELSIIIAITLETSG